MLSPEEYYSDFDLSDDSAKSVYSDEQNINTEQELYNVIYHTPHNDFPWSNGTFDLQDTPLLSKSLSVAENKSEACVNDSEIKISTSTPINPEDSKKRSAKHSVFVEEYSDSSDDSLICIDECSSSDMITNVEDSKWKKLEGGKNSILSPVSIDNESSSDDSDSSEQWDIDVADSISDKYSNNRYYSKRKDQCRRCHEQGHHASSCRNESAMKCYSCGDLHLASKCPVRVCGICYQYGHTRNKCPTHPQLLICDLCKHRGHEKQRCPDLWRRFHLTTSESTIVKQPKCSSEFKSRYCYNCGLLGHLGHNCKSPRMMSRSLPSSPFVISYKQPNKFLKSVQNSTETPCSSLYKGQRTLCFRKKFKNKLRKNLSFEESSFQRTPEPSDVTEPTIADCNLSKRKLKCLMYKKRQMLRKKILQKKKEKILSRS